MCHIENVHYFFIYKKDILYKDYSRLTGNERITKAYQLLLEDKTVALLDQSIGRRITLQYLEGIAQVRFALTVVSELVYNQHEGKHPNTESAKLIERTEIFCRSEVLNQEDSGPSIFLVKQLARQYGMSLVNSISSDYELGWIVPDFLKRKEVCNM